MPWRNGFLDERCMMDLAQKTIEDLRKDGISPTELKRLEKVLRKGNAGEAFILSGLLKTVLTEISPDASQKKTPAGLPGIRGVLLRPRRTQPQSL